MKESPLSRHAVNPSLGARIAGPPLYGLERGLSSTGLRATRNPLCRHRRRDCGTELRCGGNHSRTRSNLEPRVTADAAFGLIRPTQLRATQKPMCHCYRRDGGMEVRGGGNHSKTVERGTRDPSPQGWVHGVSWNGLPPTGPDFPKSTQTKAIKTPPWPAFCSIPDRPTRHYDRRPECNTPNP